MNCICITGATAFSVDPALCILHPGLIDKLLCAGAGKHSFMHTFIHSCAQVYINVHIPFVLLWRFRLRMVYVFTLLPFCRTPDSRCEPPYDMHPRASDTFPSVALRGICQVRHAHISFARHRTSFRIRPAISYISVPYPVVCPCPVCTSFPFSARVTLWVST